ncbi:metallo-beta-lactamase superfamily hydrolase [[Synechococcus] sp. NIES-970]|uniref:MBL fold metallo-hydrolase n=1 Tax=Picosynechococcus sp. NKBG15041c TaxID=1407650 RepID=UPI0003F5874E|nr:MBL fold metallo-hydrolase [Picosynechococcus sp. NKBG15041c]BAW96068.1 metallo-beta-lactamase superfamily hydrolase [[Synechococcus] sp. NIES-970]
MASQHQRRSHNVPGDFYVDCSCIDCDTCRWLSPDIFNRQDQQSAVYHQPETPAQRRTALQALLACPTASIGVETAPRDLKAIQEEFPLPIVENIYYCGYHSRKSFGATSYFIRHPEGNILVDSPRFQPALVKQLEALGGVKYLFLTHRDDVADHQKFHDHFGCDRLLHRADLRPGTQSVEIILEGTEPQSFLSNCLLIPVPGHTEGHVVLLYDNQYLFTGDHLAFSARLGHLTGFRNHCWYSWTAQIASMKNLLAYPITWILPGHGRRYQAEPNKLHQDLQACIRWMESVA